MSDNDGVPGDAGQGAEGTPPPSPPAPPPSPPAAPPPPPEPPKPFYASLKNAELRGYLENKGYKQTDAGEFVEALATSYRNLERLRGVPENRLLTLPENMDDAEAMKPVLAKLGLAAPEKPEDYNFAAMDGVDPEFAKTAQGWMHEIGVPPKMAQAIAQKWNAFAQAQNETLQAEVAEEVAVEKGQLEAAWGAKHGENLETARRFARMIGFSEEQIAAIETNVGYKSTMEAFLRGGQRLGEAGFVDGGKPKNDFAMTPDAARSQRDALMGDKDFLAKYLSANDPGHRLAKEKIDRLNQIIAGGQAKGAGA